MATADLEGRGDAFRLLLLAAFRDWRGDAIVHRASTDAMEIRSDKPIPALRDGDQFSFSSPVEIRTVARAFRVLVPPR